MFLTWEIKKKKKELSKLPRSQSLEMVKKEIFFF